MKPIDITDATILVVSPKGTWVIANVRADVSIDPVYDGAHGQSVAPPPIAHDFTVSGVCDFFSWTAASQAAVQQSIANNPSDQKEG